MQGRNKLGNKKVLWYGKEFDSKKEAERYILLRTREKNGSIRNLQTQVKFELIPAQTTNGGKRIQACNYIADFTYEQAPRWDLVVEDVKGYKGGATYQVFMLKWKLMLRVHGIEVQIV